MNLKRLILKIVLVIILKYIVRVADIDFDNILLDEKSCKIYE